MLKDLLWRGLGAFCWAEDKTALESVTGKRLFPFISASSITLQIFSLKAKAMLPSYLSKDTTSLRAYNGC